MPHSHTCAFIVVKYRVKNSGTKYNAVQYSIVLTNSWQYKIKNLKQKVASNQMKVIVDIIKSMI